MQDWDALSSTLKYHSSIAWKIQILEIDVGTPNNPVVYCSYTSESHVRFDLVRNHVPSVQTKLTLPISSLSKPFQTINAFSVDSSDPGIKDMMLGR